MVSQPVAVNAPRRQPPTGHSGARARPAVARVAGCSRVPRYESGGPPAHSPVRTSFPFYALHAAYPHQSVPPLLACACNGVGRLCSEVYGVGGFAGLRGGCAVLAGCLGMVSYWAVLFILAGRLITERHSDI